MIFSMAGCKGSRLIEPHLLPGFVPGSQNVFHSARIAVAPTSGSHRTYQVGKIYDADGSAKIRLAVRNPAAAFNAALAKGLEASGLQPVVLTAYSEKPGQGVDFLLNSELEEIQVDKRYGAEETVHGRYFTMRAVVKAKIELRGRDGRVLYAGTIMGVENEPPSPVGHEVFLPLETEPSESLTVALSRAVGNLITEPGFRRPLPMLIRETSAESTIPAATPLPTSDSQKHQ
ncbi:MAG: hypothetical protein JWM69_834 [Candidatus Binatus sp.]|nr:hypothetical protein [Candidatus Binatus sp.]